MLEPFTPWVNEVRLEGTLTCPCAVRTTPTGLSVAVAELDHAAEFPDTTPVKRLELKISVVLFDTLADRCAGLAAGTPVRIVGRLNQKRWIRDNRIRWGQVEIIATAMETISSRIG
ncbi:MAG: single-stranded DNA-binding protein [Magnetococcales bacterium]|nr:single-stranded DNA-binding protein [Magnetococcales bacterium]